jgi:hypothetical protein
MKWVHGNGGHSSGEVGPIVDGISASGGKARRRTQPTDPPSVEIGRWTVEYLRQPSHHRARHGIPVPALILVSVVDPVGLVLRRVGNLWFGIEHAGE